MSTDITMAQKIAEAERMVQLRSMQMTMAAMYRDAGDIDQDDWDGYAARYAASVRELQVLQYQTMAGREALAETTRGETWVQM
jgi:hypothetical protein